MHSLDWLESWLLPGKCVLSGEPTQGIDLSEGIINQWKVPDKVCPQCCESSPDRKVCGACITTPPAFDRTQVAFYFQQELVDLVHALKYQNQISHARILGELLAKVIDADGIEALVAVPLHPLRWRDRGFNQSQLIAETVGKQLGIPLINAGVKRVKATSSQTGLSAKQRQRNLRNAFTVDPELFSGYQNVALLDDVITTGATMQSLAQLIKSKTAVQNIQAWAVAKTQ